MDGFGHQHRYVRPLGDGWQLVETGGRIETPGLREPCRRLATSTGRPVLAAHTSLRTGLLGRMRAVAREVDDEAEPAAP